MKIEHELEERDIRIVAECLAATVDGNFFPDWEFETLLGVSRDMVRRALKTWPNIDIEDKDVSDAIVSSLNNLLGYPHRKEKEWSRFISAGPVEVKTVLDRLIALGL